MRVSLLKIWLAVLLAFSLPLVGAAQAPAEPAFTLACRSGARVGGDKQQFCEVRDLAMAAPVGQPLLIHGANGGTTVRGWDGPDVRIKVLVQSGGRTVEEAQARVQAVAVTAAGNTLRAVLPDLEVERRVRYEVFVPRQTALVVTAPAGELRFENLQGRLAFQGGSGSANLLGLGGQVTGSISNGSITVVLSGSTWEGEGLDVRTTNGNIWWCMPPSYSARLLMSTTNGHFFTGLPVTQVGNKQEVNAAVGQGGALLKASTVNGTVYFRAEDGGTLFRHSADPVNPTQPITTLKKALATANLEAADSLLARGRRLAYVPGQVVALAQLAARQQAQEPAAAAAHLQEATQLAGQLRDVGDAGWALGQISRLEGRLARQSPTLVDYYAPLRQALGDAMNTSAAFKETPSLPAREKEAALALAGVQRRLRGLDAALGNVPLPPAVPGLLGRYPLPNHQVARHAAGWPAGHAPGGPPAHGPPQAARP
jgi:hypothetical protein